MMLMLPRYRIHYIIILIILASLRSSCASPTLSRRHRSAFLLPQRLPSEGRTSAAASSSASSSPRQGRRARIPTARPSFWSILNAKSHDDDDDDDDPPLSFDDDPIPLSSLPHHLAIILDGNGRWAEQRGLSRGFGHGEGAARALEILKACQAIGIKTMTLYCLSTENWSRPPEELSMILTCIESSLRSNLAYAHRNEIRLVTIGQNEGLPESLRDLVLQMEEETASYQGMTLCLALSYGGQDEILRACQSIAQEAIEGKLQPNDINDAIFDRHLESSSKGLSYPDLVIRTSGEYRLSNFMLYQLAYAELYTCKALWPDFYVGDLRIALKDFAQRRRRFGGLHRSSSSFEGEGRVTGRKGLRRWRRKRRERRLL